MLMKSNRFILTQHLLLRTIRTSTTLLYHAYKRSEPIRQKLFFEFMVFILNPGLGHALCVFLFWPGWMLLWVFVLGYWFFG